MAIFATTTSVYNGRVQHFAALQSTSKPTTGFLGNFRLLSGAQFDDHAVNRPHSRYPIVRIAATSSPTSSPSTGPSSSDSNTININKETTIPCDFLVLGSGIAGLTYALKVADHGRVAVVTKGNATDGCTQYAQGGICAVLDHNDSVEAHIRDTIVAGAFLNDVNAVDVVCREGPGYVLELAEFGANFTRSSSGDLHLTREGGHSARRVVHAADATGAEIERALVSAARAHPGITFYEGHQAVDLVLGPGTEAEARVALGADVLDPSTMTMKRFLAPVTMLATGGAGQVYPLTTNPGVATGDGMAMAHRAKAAVANMEFVQFHPTALYNPRTNTNNTNTATAAERAFLISEAVRGEGGRLLTADDASLFPRRRFMNEYDPRGELAPRDIVARAIHSEMAASGAPHVYLDISHLPAKDILRHFPTIAAHCASAAGIDITRDPIPVLPAQHYMCGGVQTGLHGETSIPGLYACGEVTCSGLHGANRLASNSLLEGLVFGNRAVRASVAYAETASEHVHGALRGAAAEHAALMMAYDPSSSSSSLRGVSKYPRELSQAASAWISAKRQELTSIMWNAAGIVRQRATMKKALHDVAEIYVETSALCESYGVNQQLIELRNLVTVGELILSSALQRRESRGGHYCTDFPEIVPQHATATVIQTSLRRRLDLKKVKVGKSVTPLGNTLPGSPKRERGVGVGGRRELSVMRSNEE